jgi:hypothetical protein
VICLVRQESKDALEKIVKDSERQLQELKAAGVRKEFDDVALTEVSLCHLLAEMQKPNIDASDRLVMYSFLFIFSFFNFM